MRKTFLIAGFGGQGVQTLGTLLAIAATEAGYKSTFLPAYGGEMRGGTSNCTTTISDRFIGDPNAETYDMVVALSAPAYAKFSTKVKEGGTLVYNCSLIKPEAPVEKRDIIALDLAAMVDEIGNPLSLNAILFGFLVGLTDEIPDETGKNVLRAKLGKNPKYRDMNDKAFELGLAKSKE